MTKVNLQNIVNLAYARTQYYYRNWKNYDELTNTNCLKDRTYYTFAEDMGYYASNLKTAKVEIEKYINRMLKRFCRKNPQAYFEMILSVNVMCWIFYEAGLEELSRMLENWYYKLFYDEKFIYQYITEEEISKLWGLR